MSRPEFAREESAFSHVRDDATRMIASVFGNVVKAICLHLDFHSLYRGTTGHRRGECCLGVQGGQRRR